MSGPLSLSRSPKIVECDLHLVARRLRDGQLDGPLKDRLVRLSFFAAAQS